MRTVRCRCIDAAYPPIFSVQMTLFRFAVASCLVGIILLNVRPDPHFEIGLMSEAPTAVIGEITSPDPDVPEYWLENIQPQIDTLLSHPDPSVRASALQLTIHVSREAPGVDLKPLGPHLIRTYARALVSTDSLTGANHRLLILAALHASGHSRAIRQGLDMARDDPSPRVRDRARVLFEVTQSHDMEP